MSARRGRAREDGIVVPAFLAIMVVVSSVALIAAERHRTRVADAESQTRSLRLQGLADGAARLVETGFVPERTRGLPGLGLLRNGTAVTCPLPEGRRIAIAVQDHAGLVDLNTAPRPLLETAFRAIGIDDSERVDPYRRGRQRHADPLLTTAMRCSSAQAGA